MKREDLRLLLAIVIAPLAASILFSSGLFAALIFLEPPRSLGDIVGKVMHLTLLEIPASYMATIVLGAPYFLLLKRCNQLTLVRLVAGGALGGILLYVGLVVVLPSGKIQALFWWAGLGMVEESIISGVLGISVAVVFYFVGITHRSRGTR
ncbi:MAG: hypothetical protein HY080_05575 [Gammaproteobacteria bacterium]|nr:hypothetical protein [Gammaproteobacteria bacterium]